MFLLFLLSIRCARDVTHFCEKDADCRPGFVCGPEESDCSVDPLCTWIGHCLGDNCATYDDCDRDLICVNSRCASISSVPITVPSPKSSPSPSPCVGCLGSYCDQCDQCDASLVCKDNKCTSKSMSGNRATLTYFDDNTFECIGQTTPPAFSVAVNPILLGYTPEYYKNLNGATPPWCGKTMTLTVNGKVFIGTVIDTCNPLDSEGFPDPVTEEIIGGKCDYDDVIDLYGETGRNFLLNVVGDDFFQGNVQWELT